MKKNPAVKGCKVTASDRVLYNSEWSHYGVIPITSRFGISDVRGSCGLRAKMAANSVILVLTINHDMVNQKLRFRQVLCNVKLYQI